jgi:hypothetical protein
VRARLAERPPPTGFRHFADGGSPIHHDRSAFVALAGDRSQRPWHPPRASATSTAEQGQSINARPSRRRAIPAPSETHMNRNEARSTMLAGAAVALVLLASSAVLAAEPASPRDEAPIVVAQAGAVQNRSPAAASIDAYPAYQRGVREAAAQSDEALRRYIWRTRMIYNFYFQDYVERD